MTMSAYRTPGQIEPTLTEDEEKRILRALRPRPWVAYLYFAFWILSVVVEAASIPKR